MRFMRIIAILLCLSLLASVSLAESVTAAPSESPVSQMEEENIISPLHQPPEYVDWLIKIARKEIGYTEDRGGVTKYGTWAGYPTAEWCAEFLCWCVNQVDKQHGTNLLNSTYPNYSGTNVGRDWFISQGRYISRKGNIPGWGSQWFSGESTPMETNGYIPMPGDWVFFSNTATGDTTHVAMVEYCSYDENGNVQIHVIEGNNPSSVARNTYPLHYWAILGYGTVYDLADVVMRFGNDGEKVKALQRKLVQAGLLDAQYVTGRYGSITTQAIKDFQRLMNLNQSGIANHETQLKLHEYLVNLSE